MLDNNESYERLHCLPIIGGNGNALGRCFCLALVPTSSQKGEFRRGGILGFLFEWWRIKPWNNGNNIQSEEWLEFEEYDGVSKCTIKIM
jgi:hypothetical protein